MISIIEEKCCGCGACQKYCPAGIINLQDQKATVKKAYSALCMNCGHCQSVCHFDAITLFGESENLKPAKNNVAFADLKDLIESNRSIRKFKDTLVEQSKIEEILTILDHTGSAKNQQPVKWIVISSKEKVEEVSEICVDFLKETKIDDHLLAFMKTVRNPITVSAPHLLIAYTDKTAIKPHDDCMIKTTLASLLMHSDGIGSCFLGYLASFINASAPLKAHLGLEEGQTVYSAIGFGYNDNEVYPKVPARKKSDVRFIQ